MKLSTVLAMSAALCSGPMGSAQSFTTIYTFPSISVGYSPNGVPYIGAGGVLFGTTGGGGTVMPCDGTLGCGAAFSLAPPSQTGGSWTQTTLYDFMGMPDGSGPITSVLPGTNGTLLGTTIRGGPGNSHCRQGCGTLFQLTPPSPSGGAWTESILYDFAKVDFQPDALVAGSNGSYFGSATFGGSKACELGCGSIYESFPPSEAGGTWSLTQIHEFAPDTGEYPNSPLVVGPGGVLYGTTEGGGNNSRSCISVGCGVTFSLTPPVPPSTAWTFQDI
jgi:hypothetical protein